MRRAAPRRLSRTAVEQATRETQTRDFVDHIGDTEKLADGRREVTVILFDSFEDPRSTPAGEALIGHLEASGWVVTHRHGRRYSTLTVSEPVSADLSV
jgi:hypothetical protein